MLLSSSPSIYIQRKYSKIIWKVIRKQAKITREMNLSSGVLTGEEYAKELRLFGLQELWLKRWQSQFLQFFTEIQLVRKKGAIVVLLWSMFSRIGVALPFIYVVMGALGGRYTLGDLALYSGLIVQVEQSLQILIGNYTNLYDISLGVSPIFQLLDLKPELQSPIVGLASRQPSLQDSRPDSRSTKYAIGIQIKHLSFCYPGSNKSTVENINLTIQPGEMIALVGEKWRG
jgi:hypothetical protein